MNVKRISAISLSNRDFENFAEKLDEACRWVTLAAQMGSDLAVLPEMINGFAGDGPGNPRAMSLAEIALEDWQLECHPLIECASANGIAVTVPVLIREADHLLNAFYLVDGHGRIRGRYVKENPTIGELEQGVAPGSGNVPIPWEGLRVGGAICFDTNFPDLFARQKATGADLFLCPSLCPGGEQLSHYARTLQLPIVIAYPAWSRVIDRMGHVAAEGGYRHETLRFGFGVPVYAADINFDAVVFHLDSNQEKIEDILRAYGRNVWITFDQDNMCFCLESRSTDVTIDEVIERFRIQPLDEYMAEARGKIERH